MLFAGAGWRGSVQVLVSKALLLQGRAQQGEVVDELAEDEGSVSALFEFVEQGQQGRLFAIFQFDFASGEGASH